MTSRNISWIKTAVGLIIFIAIAEGAGVIGSYFTIPNIPTWYASLDLPSWRPPAFVFAPVWINLYALMAIAAYIVWSKRNVEGGEMRMNVRNGLMLYVAQLIVNVLWVIVFFGAHALDAGFNVIIVLWLLIAATILFFKKVSKLAGWLMLPYLLWVSFATILNLAIWLMN